GRRRGGGKKSGSGAAISPTLLLRRASLPQKLDQPLPTKDGGTLRTVLDARAYMLALSKDREHRSQWQRAAWAVRRHPDRGAVARGRGEPHQRARRGRDRARDHDLRAPSERWPHRARECVGK